MTAVFVGFGMAVATMLSTPVTANADILDELGREFSTARGAGQLANLLNDSLRMKSMGVRPSAGELAAVQDALRYRPNQRPLIEALESLVAGQSKRLRRAETIARQQQAEGGQSISINQYDPSNPGGFISGSGGINLGGSQYTIGSGRPGAVAGSAGR